MDHEIKIILVKDIMTRQVISVLPDMPVLDAAKIVTEHNFSGLPVVDKNNHIIGILTEYDLINKTSTGNVTFLHKILSDIYSAKRESQPETKNISDLKVREVMNPEPLTLREDATFEDAIETFKAHHRVNPIPIVNDQNQVVGIISRFDILRPLNILGYSKNKLQ